MTAEKIPTSFNTHERVIVLEQVIIGINKSLHNIEARFDKIDARFEKLENQLEARFEKIDDKFDKIDSKFDRINDKIDFHFKWVVGIILTSVVLPSFVPAILHAFKLV